MDRARSMIGNEQEGSGWSGGCRARYDAFMKFALGLPFAALSAFLACSSQQRTYGGGGEGQGGSSSGGGQGAGGDAGSGGGVGGAGGGCTGSMLDCDGSGKCVD